MAKNKTKLIAVLAVVLVIAGTAAYFTLKKDAEPAASVSDKPASSEETPAPTAAPFNKGLYSVQEPDSLWVIVNKKRPLPTNFAPGDLTSVGGSMMRAEASKAAGQLIDGAKKDGVQLKVISGYRSYATQRTTYNSYVQKDGQAAADTYSARPGHSEHQTGLAADLGNVNGNCDLDACFGTTPAGKWLAGQAHEYGFVIRYMEDKDALTGYQYEPWHIRYVGPELAVELKNSGQTMEQFFGLQPAPGY